MLKNATITIAVVIIISSLRVNAERRKNPTKIVKREATVPGAYFDLPIGYNSATQIILLTKIVFLNII